MEMLSIVVSILLVLATEYIGNLYSQSVACAYNSFPVSLLGVVLATTGNSVTAA